MKKIIKMVLIFLCFSGKVMSQEKTRQTFSVTVDVSNIKPVPEILILNYFNMENGKMNSGQDSVGVRDGKGTFTGKISEPSFATLQTKFFEFGGTFILSANNLYIKSGSNIQMLTVSGSPFQKDFEVLQAKKLAIQEQIIKIGDQYNRAMEKKDSIAAKPYADKIFELNRQIAVSVYKNYAKSHAKTSALSVFAMQQYAGFGLPGVDSIYNSLAPAFKKLPTAIAIKAQLDEVARVTIGKTAPELSQPDTSGKVVSLKSFRGKYVLLDFWASWCHPCREESPYLIKAYEKFKANKFEILSVSMDSEKAKGAWLKAISDDKVGRWTHLADLKGFDNVAGKLYGIQSIPQNFLINPDGKIVAVNLRGDDLEKKLSEIFRKATPNQ
ncbi:TlpA disulfide reductase family protein [Pedobacter frigidisoli]|uniref:TlpA disulfide reductase family protein n=1 Tax=Pedobacter frigidisoli TaxID=2530455 RepID=UPI00292CC0D3|nr:TlpA disulfide reductase family protein [Pedobacter frigidisoli]